MFPGFTFTKAVFMICLMTKASAIRIGAFRALGKDGVTFQDGLVFESLAKSKIDCARRCSERDDCLHFTWVSSSSSGASWTACRGHSSCRLDDSRSTDVPGAKTYTLVGKQCKSAWLNKTCTSNSQCPAAVSSECFKGQCLCTPGYYYSNSQDSCTATCEETDLQSTFLRYPGSAIYLHNLYCITTGFDQCLQQCLSDSECRTLDFGYSTQECCAHSVTPLQVSHVFYTDYDLYQKTCA